MTPEQAYLNAIEQHNFTPDPVQAKAVQLTQQLYQQLNEPLLPDFLPQFLSQCLPQLLSQLLPKRRQKIKGLYFWGGVGRGKTWLIDSFFNTLPFSDKQRIHFHSFMQEIHAQLKNLPKTPDPLVIIAKQMAQEFQILCIDEFHIQDITDAMLLTGLLDALFSQGVVLVLTSNIAPDELYKNGLQRDSFLPAIKLIKQNTRVFELNSSNDYRTLVLEKEGCYHFPLDQYHNDMMQQHFIKMSCHAPIHPQFVDFNKRLIQVIAVNHSSKKHPQAVIWFEFDELCNTPRSNSDYLSIAQHYPYILLSNIYAMDEQKDDVAKRFVHLIDALYDNHCVLVISAETEPDKLYDGRRLKVAFQRTASRLKEMRSKLYRGKQAL